MGGPSGAFFFSPRFSTSLTTSQPNAHNNAPNNNENGHTTTRTANCGPNDNPAATIGPNDNVYRQIHRFPLSSTHPRQLTTTPHSLKESKPAPRPSKTSGEPKLEVSDDAKVSTTQRRNNMGRRNPKPACRMTRGCREPSADVWSTKPNTRMTNNTKASEPDVSNDTKVQRAQRRRKVYRIQSRHFERDKGTASPTSRFRTTRRCSEPDVEVSNDMKTQQFIYKSNDIAELDAWNDTAQQTQRSQVQRVNDGGLGLGADDDDLDVCRLIEFI